VSLGPVVSHKPLIPHCERGGGQIRACAPQSHIQVGTLSSLDFAKITVVCLASFGMAACIGVTGKPNVKTAAAGFALLDITPLTVNFGNVAAGSTAQQGVNIVNTGTASAKITRITMKGSGFSVNGISVPLTIEAGGSANFMADFVPGSTGAASGSISLVTDANSSPIVIGLQGMGTGASIAVTPSSGSFGDVVVGSEATQPMELKAAGSANIKITKVSTTGTGFSVSGLAVPLTLTPGQSASFMATFKPATTGAKSGTISITSTADDSVVTVDLVGKGDSAVAGLSVTPTALSFGSVAVGKTTSQEVTLKSTGNTNVDIKSVSISGNGFSVSGASNITLAPGQSSAVTVKFDPSKSGSASGTVTVASSVPGSPAKISVSGSGSTTSPSSDVSAHTVTLRWAASATSTVVGYYVYRGLVGAGPFLKLNPARETSTSFMDVGVSGGQTYYYVVTAVDMGQVESAFSNQVAVTIPQP